MPVLNSFVALLQFLFQEFTESCKQGRTILAHQRLNRQNIVRQTFDIVIKPQHSDGSKEKRCKQKTKS